MSLPDPAAAASAPARTESFALAQGVRDTRAAFERWRGDPAGILRVWFGAAFAIAAAMLAGVWLVSLCFDGDPSPVYLVGISEPADAGELGSILGRNLLVLALHATACVAGFIAGSSMAQVAETKTGFSRIVHERAGPIAIGWVVLVTTASLGTQVFGLGFDAASIARNLDIGTGLLVLTVLPHALIELTAVFLPLAAWLIASRRGEWADLLAATFLTVLLALPMLLVAATIEMTVWPRLLRLASPLVG